MVGEKGKYSHNFYAGTDYGFDSSYNKEFTIGFSGGYVPKPGEFGVPSDPRTLNQLKAVSDKISTGAKTIEVSGLSMGNAPLEAIPKQHFQEINRLRKITGVDLTFHGPIIEPTGIGQGGWDPTLRQHAERQMMNAMRRAHDIDPDGNVVVTFHASASLLEPRPRMFEKGKEISTAMAIIDERTGRFGHLPKTGKEYLEENGERNIFKELDNFNKHQWTTRLSNVNISTSRSREALELFEKTKKDAEEESASFNINKFQNLVNKPEEWEKFYNALEPGAKRIADEYVHRLSYADIFAKDSYEGFKELFNDAYDATQILKKEGKSNEKVEEDLNKLDRLKKDIAPFVKDYKEDPAKIAQLVEAVSKGLRVLDNINPPKIFRPLEDFAIEKASETFSNIAFDSYKEFKGNSPIVSIENPPAGTGISRAEEMKKLIESSRQKLANKLVEENVMSEEQAKREAEKLIGATWDVGHINMIRKFGYGKKELIEETKKISPFLKHIHLSDNFGLDHTELPMGMGNVPTKEMFEALGEYTKKVKKIVETGNWFEPFKSTPLKETFRAFGSPVYSMALAPTWTQTYGSSGGYGAGYGLMFPEQHFSMYGAGFSNLPVELGGQTSGRSRASGAPIE